MSDAERLGRPASMTEEQIEIIVDLALTEVPENIMSKRWSTRKMAAEVGCSNYAAYMIWTEFDIRPHKDRGFKISKDPDFEEKVRDIGALYLSPPPNSLILCLDEKTGIQAMDRTQRTLPLFVGRNKTHTTIIKDMARQIFLPHIAQ